MNIKKSINKFIKVIFIGRISKIYSAFSIDTFFNHCDCKNPRQS